MRKIDPFHYGRIEKDEVNQQAVQNYFQLIDEAEAFYNAQIRQVVEQMGDGQDRATVICLSGPSASGKTTTAHTLARHFISSGRKAMVISLDDFYMDTEQTPLNRKGKPDFESIYALDIERINRCIKELIEQGRTSIPIFDFHVRKRLEGMEREIVAGPDDVVIIEGLHGLNPLLTQLVGEDKVTRIFASVRSRFTDHDRVILTPQDVRLMRRMVRDRFTRNTLPEETMAMWEEVCEGESAYINPFRDSADFKLDTTLDYEPNIFHSFLLPFLEDRRGIAPEHYRKLDDLYQRLDEFFDINNTDTIPQDSVIREFIGPKQTQDQADA